MLSQCAHVTCLEESVGNHERVIHLGSVAVGVVSRVTFLFGAYSSVAGKNFRKNGAFRKALMMETEAYGGYVIHTIFSIKKSSLLCLFRHSFRFKIIPLNQTSQK